MKISSLVLLLWAAFATGTALADDISNLQAAISAARGRIDTYRAATGRLTSQKAAVEAEAASLDVEAATFRASAARHKAAHLAAEEQKRRLYQEIESLDVDLFKLDQQISVYGTQLHDLESLEQKLSDIFGAHDRLVAVVGDIRSRFSATVSEHVQWVHDAKMHMRQNGPVFGRIVDYETYEKERRRIYSAWEGFPSQAALLNEENAITQTIGASLRDVEALQARARALAPSREAAALVHVLPAASHVIPAGLSRVDTLYGDLYEQLSVLDRAVKNIQESRGHFVARVVIDWLDLVAIKLHSLNLKELAAVIDELQRALRDPQVYAEIRGNLKRREQVADDLFTSMVPLLATDEVDDALDYIDRVESALPTINPSPAFKSQIEALILDERRFFAMSKEHGDQLIREQLGDYRNERSRQVRIMMQRAGDSLSPFCRQLGESLLTERPADRANEQDFLNFRNNC